VRDGARNPAALQSRLISSLSFFTVGRSRLFKTASIAASIFCSISVGSRRAPFCGPGLFTTSDWVTGDRRNFWISRYICAVLRSSSTAAALTASPEFLSAVASVLTRSDRRTASVQSESETSSGDKRPTFDGSPKSKFPENESHHRKGRFA
jgi:hypothetical protein